MDRNSKVVKITLLILFSGFVMEILSIMMFYGLIWSNIGQIRGAFDSIWPTTRVYPYSCLCVPYYRSAFYFPLFVFGFIFIFSAMTMLIIKSLTQNNFRINMQKETLNDDNSEKLFSNERRLEEIETYYDKLTTNKNNVFRRLLLVLLVISIIILTSIIFFEYALVLMTFDPWFFFINNTKLNWSIIHLFLIIIVLLVSSFIVLSYKEYWEYITYRHPPMNKGYQMLK